MEKMDKTMNFYLLA